MEMITLQPDFQTPDTYDDLLSAPDACPNLWREVLLMSINDAVSGVSSGDPIDARIRMTQDARDYLTRPNKDFNEVCHLAGLDPVAVREGAAKQIARAPSPAELVRMGKKRKPGVVSNLPASKGTGGGRSVYPSTNIAFSEMDENA